ncbi:unnamed protein product [marine sediment metagenome]|uniref:Uncharacterized protein n=1 Tax=marine sediment metagenome TaxID=412755 RepID=X1Q401_9ZZZZ
MKKILYFMQIIISIGGSEVTEEYNEGKIPSCMLGKIKRI